jgi:integrase/recombinase XerD
MTDLHQAIDSYISLRRGLGYQLRNAERALHDYAGFLQAAGETTVTTASALRWAASRQGTTAHYAVERLSHVRMFARHLASFEPGTEVPPAHVLGHTPKAHGTPHLLRF